MSKRTVYIDGNTDHVVSPPGASQLLKAGFPELAWNNILQDQEVVTVAGDGQTDFLLSRYPQDISSVLMFVNGIKQQYLEDYVLYGQVVTYIGTEPSQLLTTDTVEFWYMRGSWVPSDIEDGFGWWDPTIEGNVTKDGSDLVSAVVDSSGNDKPEAQTAAGNQPLWIADGGAGDGLGALRFSSTTKEHIDTLWTPTAEGTVWLWAYPTVIAGTHHTISGLLNGGIIFLFRITGSTGTVHVRNGTTNLISTETLSPNNWYFICYTWTATTQSVTINTVRKNGANTGTPPPAGTIPFGYYDNAAAGIEWFDGDLGQHGIYDRVLNESEIEILRLNTMRS